MGIPCVINFEFLEKQKKDKEKRKTDIKTSQKKVYVCNTYIINNFKIFRSICGLYTIDWLEN